MHRIFPVQKLLTSPLIEFAYVNASSLLDIKINTDEFIVITGYCRFLSNATNLGEREKSRRKTIKHTKESVATGKGVKNAGTCGTRHLLNCAISETRYSTTRATARQRTRPQHVR